ncbi:MAG: helix-hairpin-helix domain-containing protein [Pseudomonadales bacterium]|nr:helix-hairpin-helix domain-containing protein [Pseudomonadales bacterium]MCP5182451.1 helix-hairpin-helix domain-containing protein [Pseudomonadales bacterium]
MHIKSFLNTSVLAAALMLASPVHAGEAETVNINTATAEEIARVLDGVGLSRARAIVEYRDANGGFKDVYELEDVSGIGERTVILNEARIRIR